MKVAALALVSILATAACGRTLTLNYINFPVEENGHPVEVKKFFMDGALSEKDARPRAFAAAQQKDIAGATTIMQEEVARDPKDAWNHYDLAILYEATGAWDKADAEIKEAQRTAPPKDTSMQKRFSEESEFIARHKK